MSHAVGFLVGICALVWLTTSCGTSDGAAITVVAASSMQQPLDDIAVEWERSTGVAVNISYAGSQSLAAQLRNGFDADVAVFANEALVSELVSSGIATTAPVGIADSEIVLGFAPGVTPVALGDLIGSPLVVILADPAVPLGGYSRDTLEREGLDIEDLAPASLEPSAAAVVTRLRTGDADAGLIYATDGDGFTVVELNGLVAHYFAVRLGRATEEANAFFDHLQQSAAKATLLSHGFQVP